MAVKRSKVVPSNPLKADPTRTGLLRKKFESQMAKRFKQIKKAIVELVVKDDAFGLGKNKNVLNVEKFQGNTSREQAKKFKQWLQTQVASKVMQQQQDLDSWMGEFIQEGFSKGAGRVFSDFKGPLPKNNNFDQFMGGKEQFLRQSFAQPLSVERLEALVGRTFDGLQGITEEMSNQLVRVLADGLVTGVNPNVLAKNLTERIDKIGITRAKRLARTEVIRAHAEGQLTGLENLGVDKVGVQVEWHTAGDAKVCPLCAPLEGAVLKISEARGMLPRHPNCRCAWIPANIGEEPTGQKKNVTSIRKSIAASIKAEGKNKKTT